MCAASRTVQPTDQEGCRVTLFGSCCACPQVSRSEFNTLVYRVLDPPCLGRDLADIDTTGRSESYLLFNQKMDAHDNRQIFCRPYRSYRKY
jgi:hypothetical protein